MRYVLNNPTSWAFDMSYILYGGLFIMSGAYALSRDAHVRGDVLFRLLRPRTQAIIELVLYFIFFYPGVTALVIAGYGYAHDSFGYHGSQRQQPRGGADLATQGADPAGGHHALHPGHRPGDPLHPVHTDRCLAAQAPRRGGTRKHAPARNTSNRLPPRARNEQSGTRAGDAGWLHLRHPARISDRLHVDGDGRHVRLLRLLPGRAGLLRQPGLLPAVAEHLQHHEQRRADRRAVVPVHGLHDRDDRTSSIGCSTACRSRYGRFRARWPWPH